VRGTATPGTVIEVAVDGETYEVTAGEDGTWTFTPSEDWPEGELTITVSVGGTSESVTVNVDATAPTLTLTGVDESGIVSGTGEPGTTVEVRVNGALVGTAVVGDDGTFTLDVSEARVDGDNEVEVTATDEAGNEARASQTFTWTEVEAVLTITGGGGCEGGGLGLSWLLGLFAVALVRRRSTTR
ncbi:MAG TPA: Ig-like domain-containing protein, partial [Myxococcota bacterium]|nr:Ig-like domain-containing protein [Myxococcota bacterium]